MWSSSHFERNTCESNVVQSNRILSRFQMLFTRNQGIDSKLFSTGNEQIHNLSFYLFRSLEFIHASKMRYSFCTENSQDISLNVMRSEHIVHDFLNKLSGDHVITYEFILHRRPTHGTHGIDFSFLDYLYTYTIGKYMLQRLETHQNGKSKKKLEL